MVARLFILFSMMSLAEIYLLITVGSVLGGLTTISLILVTAFVGASLVRSQGLQTLLSAKSRMAKGEIPAQQMIEGMMLVVAGVLLITPGFITDTLGLLILVPQLRLAVANKFMANASIIGSPMGGAYTHSVDPASFDNKQPDHSKPQAGAEKHHGSVIEGEYEKRD